MASLGRSELNPMIWNFSDWYKMYLQPVEQWDLYVLLDCVIIYLDNGLASIQQQTLLEINADVYLIRQHRTN